MDIRKEIDSLFDDGFLQAYFNALKDSFNLINNTEDEFVRLICKGNLTNKQVIELAKVQQSNQRLKLDTFEKLYQLYKDVK